MTKKDDLEKIVKQIQEKEKYINLLSKSPRIQSTSKTRGHS